MSINTTSAKMRRVIFRQDKWICFRFFGGSNVRADQKQSATGYLILIGI